MTWDSVPLAGAALTRGAELVDVALDPVSGRGLFTLRRVPPGLEEDFHAARLRVEPAAFARVTGDLFAMIRARERARAGRRGW